MTQRKCPLFQEVFSSFQQEVTALHLQPRTLRFSQIPLDTGDLLPLMGSFPTQEPSCSAGPCAHLSLAFSICSLGFC